MFPFQTGGNSQTDGKTRYLRLFSIDRRTIEYHILIWVEGLGGRGGFSF